MARTLPEWTSQGVAFACTALLFLAFRRVGSEPPPPPARESGVLVSLAEMEPQAPDPPHAPQPEAPHSPEIRRRVAAPRHAAVVPAAAAPVLAAEISPVAESPVAQAVPPSPAPGAESTASLEDAYAALLRMNVDSRTRPPDGAEYRLIRPHGAAQVAFTLDRGGTPLEVKLVRPSGSRLLDRQALDIVAGGHYPPFPAAAYPGEPRHVFIVTIEFRA
jgi:protein TonB